MAPAPEWVGEALRLLALRDHSRAELCQKLLSRGFEVDMAEVESELLARGVSLSKVQDSLIERIGADADHGVVWKVSKLKNLGLTSDEVVNHLVKWEAAERDHARALLERKKAQTPQKAASLLANRGFREETIEAILEERWS